MKTLNLIFCSWVLGLAPTVWAEGLASSFLSEFKLGAALQAPVYMGEGNDETALVIQNFNAITAENEMKPEELQPHEGVFNWTTADQFVSFGQKHGMKIIGHCLVWHNQTAKWMFENAKGEPCDRETLIARMRAHISAVVGRYKGRVHGWDVVNEAFDANGKFVDTPWLRIVGSDFIELAFRFAHEADPQAELYYNDFGMDAPGKRAAVVALIRELRAKGIPIHGIGMQTHASLVYPNLHDYEQSLAAFAAEGVKVMATELDVSVLPAAWHVTAEITAKHHYDAKYNPWKEGELPATVQQQLASRYADFFRIYRRYAAAMDRVTVWGVSDRESWLNDFPMKGRTDYPLLFDRQLKAKACVEAIRSVAQEPLERAVMNNSAHKAIFTHFLYKGEDALAPIDQATEFRNPIIAGMGADPAITRKGNDFYLANSSFSYFPGIPIYHSTDLINWDFCGYVGNRKSNLTFSEGLDLSAGVFAPDIKYNPYNDTFYLIVTVIGDRGNVVYKTKDPYLGWSEPIPVPVGGIDPGFYFEDEKTAWIVNNDDAPGGKPEYDGHRTVRIRKYDLLTDQVVPGTETILVNKGVRPEEKPIWCEGPHLYRIGDLYYLMTAEGGTGGYHSEVIWIGEKPTGPFRPAPINPILTQRDLPADRPQPITAAGHADLFQSPDGAWWAVFLGIDPYQVNGRDMCNTGRSTFLLPVEWVGEGATRQPIILPQGKTIPRVMKKSVWQQTAQTLNARASVIEPLAGNTRYQTNFSTTQIPNGWFGLRGDLRKRDGRDHARFWAKCAENGAHGLSLEVRPVSMNERSDPSYLCRWVKNKNFTAQTLLRFTPKGESDFAGMSYYQNEKNHYELGLMKMAGRSCVVLRQTKNGVCAVLAKAPLLTEKPIHLRIVSRGPIVTFAYSIDGRDWLTLGGQEDATILSTDHAGGFVAATIGLFATGK